MASAFVPCISKYARRLGFGAWLLAIPVTVLADEAPAPETPPVSQAWAVHGQTTFTEQGNLGFSAPYSGPNSLPPAAEGRETFDLTLFAGVRPWQGAEVWANPEVDQGFGLGNTLGAAGFPSGEAYKVGASAPYVRLQRLFLRQTIDLGGERVAVDADQNQLAGSRTADRIVLTIGKFNVTDVFDTNGLAHDPRSDFLNWALIDAGTFDYAADAWGYTVGASVEWYVGDWVTRLGVFDLSDVPNSPRLDSNFGQFQIVGELERDFRIGGEAGSLKLTGFLSRGRMASYADAITLGAQTGEPPNVALVRQYRGRGGLSFDVQQQLTADLGLFARGGFAGGGVEPYEFTDIDRTVSAGMSLNGRRWGRPADTVAIGGVVNGISNLHERYLAAGGLGILVGDGQLPHPTSENILETYYDLGLGRIARLASAHVTIDYQFVDNPGYNSDRGPASILAARLHAQF